MRSREPGDATALPASDPALVAIIRDEMAETGPLTFARFMELALYHPEHGYYRAAAERATRGGDFLTAPEMDPIFGRTLGRQLAEIWTRLGRPDPFTVLEYGAGSGALAASLVVGLRHHAPQALTVLRYAALELNEHRRAELRARFEAMGLARHLVDPATLEERPAVGVVLANEFVDALPVHRVEMSGGELREGYVGWDERTAASAKAAAAGAEGVEASTTGRERADPTDPAAGFVEVLGQPSSPDLAARLVEEDVSMVEGQRAEVCLALGPWLDEVARRLARGVAIIIDYGHPARELYGPTRRAGTLLAYAGHRANEEILRAVGQQDLTAHVDVTAVERLAEARGFSRLGRSSLQAFLLAAGLGDELASVQADPATGLAEYASTRAAVGRLLDPRQLGGFHVLGLGRGLPDGGTFRSLAIADGDRGSRSGSRGPGAAGRDAG